MNPKIPQTTEALVLPKKRSREQRIRHQVTFFLDSITKIVADIPNKVLTRILTPLKQFSVKDTSVFLPDRNTPLNQTNIIMAHNAYNIQGTG